MKLLTLLITKLPVLEDIITIDLHYSLLVGKVTDRDVHDAGILP